MTHIIKTHLSVLAALSVAPLATAQTVTFEMIDNAASANDMSPDGRYIVGESDLNGDGWADGTYILDTTTGVMRVIPEGHFVANLLIRGPNALHDLVPAATALDNSFAIGRAGPRTSSTRTSATVGMTATFSCASCTRISPMPQPGAVSVMSMLTERRPSVAGSISQR